MDPRLKMAMMRRRRSDGTYMNYPDRMIPPMSEGYYPDWGQPEMPYDADQRQMEGRPMNRIGFATPEEIRRVPAQSEVGYRKGHKEQGYAMSYGSDEQLPPREATEWVKSMENADGTTGEHYSMEQVDQIMEQQKIPLDKVEFYTAMNMMYSDYCKVAKKFNCSTPEFYACLAKAFLEDKDAEKGKLKRYYECIVKH